MNKLKCIIVTTYFLTVNLALSVDQTKHLTKTPKKQLTTKKKYNLPTADQEKNLNQCLNPFAGSNPKNEKIAIALIKKFNLNPNYKLPAALDPSTSNLIHLAVFHGYLELLKELIKDGANINIGNKTRWRPLHIAANLDSETIPNKLEIIKLLVENGAILDNKIADLPRPIDLVHPNSTLDFEVYKYLMTKMLEEPASNKN